MTGRHILVIDDEDSVRKIICENLNLSGFRISAAADGRQGLDMIDPSDLPAVVITDMIMPGISGLDVIVALRRDYPAIRLIAISGGGRVKETDDFLERAGQMGADAVLSKPFDLDVLERLVGELAGK